MAKLFATGNSRLSRRSALALMGGAGLAGLARLPHARAAQPVTIVSWASAGQRWEFAQKGVYPLFRKKFPSITVQFAADPIAEMLPKSAIVMASHTDRYDVIQDDYTFLPQFVEQHTVEPIEPYLDRDPAFKADILSDIPENVLDLYRDKPAKQGGKLYGLPPDSNTQLQYYRADVFQKAGIKGPAVTWNDAIEIAKELSQGGKRPVVGTTLKRGSWAGAVFITLLRSQGGDWFDKMAPGGWHVTLDTDEGHRAMDVLMRLVPYLDPISLNASDDEANTAMANGTWLFAPAEWGGSTMNDPKFTRYADVWKAAVVPKGNGPKGRFAPHMGGHGLIIPAYSRHKDAAWEWVKFCCSGDKEDPAIGKAWVEHTGQPARLSLLREYSNIRPYYMALMQSLPLAMRFLPIPESNTLYEVVGTEVAAAATRGKSPDQALKDMQAQATRIMRKGGYYQ